MQHYGDNFIPVIPSDRVIHTDKDPYCADPTCPCWQNDLFTRQIEQAVDDGLVTPSEAARILRGEALP